MVATKLSIIINRPASEVYNFLMDISNYPKWVSGLKKITATDGMKEGSIITFTMSGIGQFFNLQARVEQNYGRSMIVTKNNRGPMTFTATYCVNQHTDGTELELVNNINTRGVLIIAEEALQAVSDATYRADLQMLKAILELEIKK